MRDRQLAENALQVWSRHQSAQPLDRIIRNHLTSMQNHNAAADPLDRFQFVGTKQYHLAARGQLCDEAS